MDFTPPVRPVIYAQALERWKRDYWRELLTLTRGNVTEAAQIAGVSRTHVYAVISSLGFKLVRREASWDLTDRV